MEIDPFVEIQYRFKYDYAGKKVADLLKSGAVVVGAPEGVDFTAFELFEISPDMIHQFDLVLMRDFGPDDVETWAATAWRIVKPGGWLYIGSAGPLRPKWGGWQFYTMDGGSEMHSIFVKVIPAGFPFHVHTSQDTALFAINKTGRKTKRKPEEIGKDANGMIVKWFLSDCTLYLRRLIAGQPYKIFDIGPCEVAQPKRSNKNLRERKRAKNGPVEMERVGA